MTTGGLKPLKANEFSRHSHKNKWFIIGGHLLIYYVLLATYFRGSGYPSAGCSPAEPASVSPDKYNIDI
jgi:hypothetical protein